MSSKCASTLRDVRLSRTLNGEIRKQEIQIWCQVLEHTRIASLLDLLDRLVVSVLPSAPAFTAVSSHGQTLLW